MVRLDRTEQRIVGVLIEKQLSVPDAYPLSENALVDGCNQKSNRDPVTELVPFQVAGALMAMQQHGVVARVDGGGRVARYRHKLDEVLQLGPKELALVAELLLRGPQASGALKTRVARMGNHAAVDQIDAALQQLAQRSPPLVELLPLGPRERERRWRHRLGDGSEHDVATTGAAATTPAPARPPSFGTTSVSAAVVTPAAATASPDAPAVAGGNELAALRARVDVLEQRLAELRADFTRLASPPQGD